MARIYRIGILILLVVMECHAAIVSVTECAQLGEERRVLSEHSSVETSSIFTTRTPPSYSGWIFTHWSLENVQPISNREESGKAKDRATFTVYEDTVAIANYLLASQDTDADDISDGHELYWYGSLAETPASDTDGDLYTFAEEIADGTSPILEDSRPIRWFETHVTGTVVCASSAAVFCNPHGYAPYVVRSEPEGTLFDTRSEYAAPGTAVTTSRHDPRSSRFAYWTVDGVTQRNADGSAMTAVTFAVPSNGVEVVAVCIEDYDTRQKMFWYGTDDISMESDTDGDRYTFAEEVADGTSPISADSRPIRWFETYVTGTVVCASSAAVFCNPHGYAPYVVRSEPEGALFATQSTYVAPGTVANTSSFHPFSSSFAYWTVDGVAQRNADGSAMTTVTFAVPSNGIEVVAVCIDDYDTRQKMFWYGTNDISMESDTDGDLYTFAEEVADGTSPISLASRPVRWFETYVTGTVVCASSDAVDFNFQPYEQAAGAVVDGAFAPLFASPVSGAPGALFGDGTPLTPVVWDLNDDGLFDLVVLWKTGFRTYLNVGAPGNPEFEERKDISTNGVDLAMNDTAKLGVLSLDVPPLDALSATTNGATLLVSDTDGRIWYYEESVAGAGAVPPRYVLHHKVWGGSHPGFAAGLRLAAVDWEDDGDLDCLCGTADGKLMLLRDPKVGRPTNVRALVGADNVLLVWDPNAQSRIRGYRVYRSPADAETFARIAQPQLPTHRDFPETVEPYDYRVSSVSCFYTAGNSTPTETESVPTDAVRANLGAVELEWRDAACLGGGEAEVRLAIGNSLHAAAAGASFEVSYDSSLLTPVEVRPSGLTEGATFSDDTATPGVWRVTVTGGEIAAGSGTLFAFAFRAASVAAETNAAVSLASATLRATTGAALDVMAPSAPATVAITPAAGGDDPTVVAPWSLGDVDGNGRLETADLRLLAKYKEGNGRKYGAQALQAGDFNGNGRLDNADYQALRALLKEIEVL